VAVAVVSWNTRDLLRGCLQSLYADAEAGRAEVWVVDNGSSDGSAAMVAEEFPWVRLLAFTENLGFGAAVNAVAARTSTPWLSPANADVRLEPGALSALLAEGERSREVAVLAPRLITPSGETQHSVYPFPTIPFTLAYATGTVSLSRRLASYWFIDRGFDPELAREVCWAVGAFLLVRRAAWNEVGGFDESQWMYAEDLDLGWRMAHAGWRTEYVPSARVFHEESAATTKAWGPERFARWHAASYAWMARRRGLPIARIVAAINVTAYTARAAAMLPAALLGLDRGRQTRQRMLETARAHVVGLRRRAMLEGVR
jgi:GT2 family glycosyltransferase